MKKIVVGLILLSGVFLLNAVEEPCDPKTFSITVGAGVRNFSEDLFKEVYEDTPVIYSVDVAVRILRSLEIFLHTDYLSIDGQTTYTHESTTLKIIPMELGMRFLIGSNKSCKKKLFPYLGGGAGYYMIKEEYAADIPMENVDEKRLGFFAEGGLRFYALKSVFIDAKLKYIALKSENGTQLGGMAYIGGIGVSF
ncbi:MAG: outer membrane beta-barrel protein [Candidatus Aminicenantes bacterium]|nr:MAG: outer membrane beta-barrel protein [Candidatus Aminicenantes bacterium]